MESNEPTREGTSAKQTALSMAVTLAVCCGFALVVIEAELISRFIHLIRFHAESGYIAPAGGIQVMLGAATFVYVRLWRKLRMPGAVLDRDKVLWHVSYIAMCLLLALMYSTLAYNAAKAN